MLDYEKYILYVGKMKHRLPNEIEVQLPKEVLMNIYSFVPHIKKQPEHILTRSPNAEKDLRAIQARFTLRCDMRGLEDFLLDAIDFVR